MKNATRGPLAESIDRYLAHKRSLGKQLAKTEPMLHLLDGYLLERKIAEVDQITPSHLEEFVTSRPRHTPSSYNQLIGMIRRLFDWIMVHEILHDSPFRCKMRRATATRRPFLFNPEQARSLLDAALQLPSNSRAQNRGETYRLIFAILYGLGLRVGEVSRLRRRDVDLDKQLMVIRQIKFRKDRLVPFGPKMASAIAGFLMCEESRFGRIPVDSPVFTWTQNLWDCIYSHMRAFEFFDGTSQLVIPDNLKSGVKKPCYYEPELNRTYGDLAIHYGVGILPARPYRPRDKAKAEVGVQIVQRWVLAALRKRQFFSLADLNEAILELVQKLNQRPFRKLAGSRAELYQSIDRPALQPLPLHPFVYAEWKKARVNLDYHIELGGHYYSTPYQLVGKEVDARSTSGTG
jgi:site-specific recombinase XerC